MQSKEFLKENSDAVYHVTFAEHLPKILNKGLHPLQTSNWANADGERYNADGGVFAFAHPMDAFKWAFNQNFQFKKPVSIVKFKRTDEWYKDPSDDITLTMGQGEALKADGFIGPENIIKTVNFDDFKDPSELGISQAEWFKRIQDILVND